jgi:uncharacterized protein (DUF2147 family)
MKTKYVGLSILFLALIGLLGAQPASMTPVGKWKTIDDETQKAKSVVEIFKVGDKLHGKVVALFREPDEDQNPTCDDCKGDKKDKPVIGMEIIWDLSWDADDEEWSKGEIMDPDNGKTYDCYISMESPEKLKVRGFIGWAVLGRTQYWYKYEE